MNNKICLCLSPIDFNKKNPYVDKSHIFLNVNRSELYVMFDGYFNQPIFNFKEILCRIKYDSEQTNPHKYFNFEHTLFCDLDENITNKIDKINSTNSHYLYDCFQFKNNYHIPYLGYWRVGDERYIVKEENYKKINNFYDLTNAIILSNQISSSKQIVDKYFENITKIYFGYEFNKSIDNLLESVVWLVLGKSFNQPIQKYPSNLKYLTFGYDFNQLLCNLPDILERIVFGGCFNNPIDNLPDSITHLSFFVEYYGSSNFCRFGFGENYEIYYRTSKKNIQTSTYNTDIYSFELNPDCSVPSNIEYHKSQFAKKINKLPKKLTHLVIDKCDNFLNLDNLIKCTKLTHLQTNFLSDNFSLNLPNTLEYLNLLNICPKKIILPKNMKFIKMNFTNCSQLLLCLPENLETLIIYNQYYYYTKNNNGDYSYLYDLSNLPSNLKYLKILDKNNDSYYNFDYLPNSITHLTIDTKTHNSLNNLPNSIIFLWIGDMITELFYPQNNIKELYCSKNYIEKHIDSINENIIIKKYN